MKRFVIVSVSTLICLSIAWGLLMLQLPSFASGELSRALKTAVSIQSIRIFPFTVRLDSLTIENVPDSVLQKAFSAGSITAEAPLTRYAQEKILIEEITLDDVYFALEFRSPNDLRSNWSTLLQHASSGSSDTKPSSRSLRIKKLILRNIRVDVVYKSKGNTVIALPVVKEIVLTDVGTQEGIPVDQLMHSVLGEMLKSLLIRENLQDAVESLLNPSGTLDKLLEIPSGWFH